MTATLLGPLGAELLMRPLPCPIGPGNTASGTYTTPVAGGMEHYRVTTWVAGTDATP